jgi:hypothetical protein
MKKSKTKVAPIQLPTGCNFTPLKVTPSNWNTVKKVNREWYIFYRFYDPIYKPEGHFVIVKGMNHLKDVEGRREATQILIDNEINELKAGKNPFVCPAGTAILIPIPLVGDSGLKSSSHLGCFTGNIIWQDL